MRRRASGRRWVAAAAAAWGVLCLPAAAAAQAETGRDDDEPSRAEARLVESLGLGTPAIVHRLTAPGGVTARYLRAAGGERRPSFLSYPIPEGRLGRGFGSGTNGRHKALDIIADEGTSIRAAERGLVVYADDTIRGYGWMVVILHPGGWVTFYAHCKKMLVHPGESVERRQVIARVEDTGIARGHHLHFTLFVAGEVTDPYPFFRPPPPNLPVVGPMPHRGHRVRESDTPASVAALFGVEEAALRRANGLGDEEALQAGWQLIVPGQLESPPAEPTGGGRTYTVREGDTLSQIARRFGTTTVVLLELNRMEQTDVIRAGQVLRVPGGGGDGRGGADRPDTGEARLHTVREGENLTRIARRHGVTVADLRRANRLREDDDIRVGQQLAIPGGDGVARAASGSRSYTVREGDTLSAIARRTGTTIARIRDLNPGLRDADTLRPGDEIRVPASE
jgi:murein DD-endopeptidase MepM/ murein hydrolase activator NlpD